MSNTKPLLEVNSLSAKISRQLVLSDIDIDIREGECVAVVGGSGAGKSSLLRCLMGLYKPATPFRGRMTFGSETIDFKNPKPAKVDSSGMAFVPQNPQAGLDPLKRLASQWRQAIRCSGRSDLSEAEQQELLNSLGLPPLGNHYPHQWSQGMQQRLLIAFALLAKPRLLVLDEPTSALDPLIAAKTISQVMAFADRHQIAVLIVTHDLALAIRFSQRVAIMSDGRILEFGETGKLLEEPQSDYGRLLVENRSWAGHRMKRETVAPC